jgi:hypothetical protein
MADDTPPAASLYRLATGHFVSRALWLVARLGIADLVKDGAQPVAALAQATGTHATSLNRVMRLLAGEGVFAETDAGFALTAVGRCLCEDVEGSARSTVLHYTGRRMQEAWSDLEHCVRTGEPAHRRRGVSNPFADPNRTPADQAIFDAAMAELARTVAAAVAAAYDFASIRTIVDVGGGSGQLIQGVLGRHDHLNGVIFDRPGPIERARARLAAAGLGARCTTVAGDFFAAVPEGGDVYILKHVLHDWDDERAAAILAACRRAMATESRLLIVEGVYPPRMDVSLEARRAAATDINMLVSTGGRQRSAGEFDALLRRGGLRLTRILATPTPVSLVEAAPD